ncbi:TolC family protein [Desulforhopalus sp. IMCC35007]|uniref:TolC family protein n=1 Tax=Desulforhopalus sp. IMCC35007 TaxID=2569543 RepID=UPI00145CB84C|nr:TolC family protein [Desulforhopalus sp. IMCC35007]
MLLRSLCIICCLFCVDVASVAAAQKLYLRDFLDLALDKNPQLEIAVQQYRQTKGRMTQATAAYLPHLQLGVSLGRNHYDKLSPVDEDNVAGAGISASQLIYDFGQTTGIIESSRLTEEAARSNIEQYLHNVVLQVKESYYNVLEKRYLIEVAREQKESYEQHLHRARKFYEAGIRTQIDITNAELELANARLELLRAKADLQSARVELEQVIGTKPNNGQYLVASDQEVDLNNLSKSAPVLPYSLSQLLAIAPDHRPGLRQIEKLFSAAEASLKAVRGENWPLLGATGSYDGYETDLENIPDQWQVTATLTWDIFSGFETEGKIAEARAKMLELGASRRELELSIIKDITDHHLRAVENYESIEIAGLATSLAQRNLELAEGRYQAGLGDMVEYNDAQLNYTSSRADLISIYFAYLTSIARLDQAAGIDPGIPPGTLEILLKK